MHVTALTNWTAGAVRSRNHNLWLTSGKNDGRRARFLFHTPAIISSSGWGAREKLDIDSPLRSISAAAWSLLNVRGCRAQWQYKLIITTRRMIDAAYLMRPVQNRGTRRRPPPINSLHRRPSVTNRSEFENQAKTWPKHWKALSRLDPLLQNCFSTDNANAIKLQYFKTLIKIHNIHTLLENSTFINYRNNRSYLAVKFWDFQRLFDFFKVFIIFPLLNFNSISNLIVETVFYPRQTNI